MLFAILTKMSRIGVCGSFFTPHILEYREIVRNVSNSALPQSTMNVQKSPLLNPSVLRRSRNNSTRLFSLISTTCKAAESLAKNVASHGLANGACPPTKRNLDCRTRSRRIPSWSRMSTENNASRPLIMANTCLSPCMMTSLKLVASFTIGLNAGEPLAISGQGLENSAGNPRLIQVGWDFLFRWEKTHSGRARL